MFKVSGRILIDFFGYQKHFEGLTRSNSNKNHTFQQTNISAGNQVHAPHEEPTFVCSLAEEKQEANKKEMLEREEELLFMSPLLTGFALKNKLWCMSSPSPL